MASRRPHDPGPPDWDARFSAEGYLFGTAPNQFLASCRELIGTSGRVLCVADGEGRNGVWLAEQGLDVEAFDGSPVGVAKARRLAAARGVTARFEVGDVDGWDWPEEAYDVVVAIYIQFSPPAQRRRVFARIGRALRPGGLLLLEGYRVEQLAYGTGGPKIPDQLYTEAQLRDELSAFELEEVRSYDAVIDEGAAHSGLSAVIDVIARRPETRPG
jgi:SAM-dependent methyltransferase